MDKLVEDMEMRSVLQAFPFPGEVISCEPYGGGHINQTYLVVCRGGERFILQRISELFAAHADELMGNIMAVTAHLARRDARPDGVLRLLLTRQGASFARLDSGCWRVYYFVDTEGTLDHAASPQQSPAGSQKVADVAAGQRREPGNDRSESEASDDAALRILEKCAFSFGRFEELLADFDADSLYEILPDFHNTPFRYRQFHEALEKDTVGRASQVGEEISFLLEREERAGILHGMRLSGELPVRVTHNDTKLDNILFDAKTGEALCIIDLDTVMPGLSLYDFGDMVRSGASTAAEDETDLEKVHFDLSRYEAICRGFTAGCRSLTEKERDMLPWGGYIITLEQAVRFLGDHLAGDVYYHTAYPAHNLDRCRNQIRLLREMEEKMLPRTGTS